MSSLVCDVCDVAVLVSDVFDKSVTAFDICYNSYFIDLWRKLSV